MKSSDVVGEITTACSHPHSSKTLAHILIHSYVQRISSRSLSIAFTRFASCYPCNAYDFNVIAWVVVVMYTHDWA